MMGSEGKLKFKPSLMFNSFKLIANGVENTIKYMSVSILKKANRITKITNGNKLRE